jgi:F-type H+-transporting ATPase subunit alpha
LGGAVQKDMIKKIGAVVKRELLSYLETADVYQLVNIESMSFELRKKLEDGKKMLDLLKQPKFTPMSEDVLIDRFGYVIEDDHSEVSENNSDNGSSDEVELPKLANNGD